MVCGTPCVIYLEGRLISWLHQALHQATVEFLELAAKTDDNASDKEANLVPNQEYEKCIAKDQ